MNLRKILTSILFAGAYIFVQAEVYKVSSPDNNITISINNNTELNYSVTFNGNEIIGESSLGFEFRNEPAMSKGFTIIGKKDVIINESWKPVVKSKHAVIQNNCNEMQLSLLEKDGAKRKMDLFFRAYNDGVAFRYKLYRGDKPGSRQIIKELTTFNIPGNPKSWVVEYGIYKTSKEP